LASIDTKANLQPAAFIFFAHAIDIRPEPLFEPANLVKNLIATHHHFFAIQIGRDIGKLVNEATTSVDEFAEGGRGPVWD
jgi:hypothetical protein